MALPILDTPKYKAKIPSTGEDILFRPYLVKEEKVLMMALESEDQDQILRAVKEIISACTFGKVNSETLAIFDLEYLFLKLRSKSVGETSNIGIKCKKCDTSNEVSVNIDALEVTMPAGDVGTIMLTDKIGIKLRYPSVQDVSKLSKFEGADSVMKTVVTCIDNIFDADKVYPASQSTPRELEQFIESLSSEQFGKIKAFFDDMPGLKHKIEFDCDSCGTHNEFEVKGLQSFFA